MSLTTLADNPGQLRIFAQVWGLTEMYTKPVVLACTGCEDTLMLALATDTPIDHADCQVYVTLELSARGWHIARGGALRCPRCGCWAD